MLNNKSDFNDREYVGFAILLVGIMCVILFRIEDKYNICLLLVAGSLIAISSSSITHLTRIDINLCLIAIYDIISCSYANCSFPAIQTSLFSFFCLVTYFLLRELFASKSASRIIQLGSYLPIGIALFLAICSFFIFRKSVLSVGFLDTYHFRFLFRPLGYITNVWVEILLVLLAWTCIVRRHSTLFIFLSIFAILFSFSRGAYIALSIYIITWLLFLKFKRDKLRFLVISISAITLTYILFPCEMNTTLQMNHTVSQRQSTEGRVTATQVAWKTFQQNLWLGYGNGNYTFAVDQELNQNSTIPYTSYAPNIIIQLLIEKGIIGILLYLLLAVNIYRTIHKYQKQPESKIIGCFLFALVVKELTQATLLHTPFVLFMLYMLLAFLQKDEFSIDTKRQITLKYILPGIVAVCYLSWFTYNFLHNQNKLYQQQCIAAWEKGKLTEAIRLMEQTGEQTPNLINRGLLYMQYYQMTADPEYQQTAEDVLQKARRQQPEDIQIRYLQARLYIDSKAFGKARPIAEKLATDYPGNSLYLSALSDVLYLQGEKEAALRPLVNAIRYTPRLLTGKRIRDLRQDDPVFYNSLQRHLSGLTPSPNDSPADYARLGYITRWCGNQSLSEKYLRKAVEDLPNLSTPWRLLGDDNKYRLLFYGAFHKDLLSTELPEEKEMDDELLFKMSYQAKFKNWYGGELLIF